MLDLRKTIQPLIFVAGLYVFAATGQIPANAQNTAPNVTYTASGTFSDTPVIGNDTFKLAGEPFSISIVASSSSPPVANGPDWYMFGPFHMTGVVHSGLLGPTPVNINSAQASILQGITPDYDLFQSSFPVRVVGVSLTIEATIYLPPGTLATLLIHPFPAVELFPGNATVTYSSGGEATTLAVGTGTIVATAPTVKGDSQQH
jgi:hypothetical protein